MHARSIDPTSDRWQLIRDKGAFGHVTHNLIGRFASNRGAQARWQTEISQAGTYEVFIYHSHESVVQTKMQLRKERINEQTVSQYYRVEHGGEQTDVTLTHNLGKGYYPPPREEFGWLSLGKFHLPEGPTTVVLHDKGIQKQLIWADAVKWVKVK